MTTISEIVSSHGTAAATRWRALPVALIVGLAIAGTHVALVWGHASLFWGDYGFWLHSVDRAAGGEIVYRDFLWGYPPLAIWVLGGITRLVGADLVSIWTVTTLLYLAIVALFVVYAGTIVPGSLLPLSVAAAVVMSAAYAQQLSAPLPLGMYSPAAPLGFLALLAATIAAIRFVSTRSRALAVVMSIACAFAVLTKQDFWLPSGWLLAAGGVVAIRRAESKADAMRLVAAIALPFVIVVSAGAAIVASQIGWRMALGVVTGFGAAGVNSARAAPSLERLVLDVGVLAVVACVIVLALWVAGAVERSHARRWLLPVGALAIALLSLWAVRAYQIGSRRPGSAPTPIAVAMQLEHPAPLPLAKTAVTLMHERAMTRVFPTLMPLTLLALVVVSARRRREGLPLLLTALLGLCVTARLRRGFEFTEWFHVLLELPVLILALHYLVRAPAPMLARAGRLTLAALAAVGAYAYWHLGVGPLTRRGPSTAVETVRGKVRLRPDQARDVARIDSALRRLDPSARRPLFAFAYSSGFNYWFRRPPASPLTTGFKLGGSFDRDSVIASIRAHNPPVIVIDNPFAISLAPLGTVSLLRWEPPLGKTFYETFDLPFFKQVVAGCRLARRFGAPNQRAFSLHDCPTRRELTGATR